MGDAFILDAVRTPRGKGKSCGRLHETHPQELLAACLKALQERVGFDPREIEDVVCGCVSQVGEQAGAMGRYAALVAGWPAEVTGLSLNRGDAHLTISATPKQDQIAHNGNVVVPRDPIRARRTMGSGPSQSIRDGAACRYRR